MTRSVSEALQHLALTRLAHFTPAKNLPLIFRDRALRSASDLGENAPRGFFATDEERYDGAPDLISCSFEYPNAYYQDKARLKTGFRNYPDWVFFTLDVSLVEREGTRFSPCNAAYAGGAYALTGGDALLDCFAATSGPKPYRRHPNHLAAAPTDLQAEVQIPGPIPMSAIQAIVAPSAAKAGEHYRTLGSLGVDPDQIEWRYSPLTFDKFALAKAIHRGERVPEFMWTPGPGDRR